MNAATFVRSWPSVSAWGAGLIVAALGAGARQQAEHAGDRRLDLVARLVGLAHGLGAQGHGVCLAANAHERVRFGHDVEGVERLQGNIFLD